MPAAVLSILKQLTDANHSAVDRALAAALPTADPDEARHLARTLLDRKRPPGLLGLVLFFHLLPEDTQHHIIDHAPHLDRALREAASPPPTPSSAKTNTKANPVNTQSTHGPANALAIIQAANAPAMAYLVIELIRRGNDDLTTQATACLTSLLQHAQITPNSGPPPHTPPRHTALLLAAVDHALGQSARQPHPSLLDAWARLLPRPMPHTEAALQQPHTDLALELRARLIAGQHPHWLQALLPALRYPALTDAGIDGLQVAAQQHHLNLALQRGHFLSLRPVQYALTKTAEPTRLLPPDTPDTPDTHPNPANNHNPAERWLPAYLDTLPLPTDERAARLTDLATHDDPAVRLAALRRLIAHLAPPQLDQPEPAELRDAIARFANDPLPAIARTAVHTLLHDHRRRNTANASSESYAELLARLINSPHPDIARRASEALGPIAFDRLWSNWPRLNLRQRLAAGRALLRAHPDPYRPLTKHLASPRKPQRLRALHIIATLGQAELFEPALLKLADHPDATLAASAVKALGSATSPQAHQHLLDALDHKDPRVRANAIEALAQTDANHADYPTPTDTLTRIATHDDNRPRANAIAALARLGHDHHQSLLADMLRDPRAPHRLSGLWLIEHLNRLDLATTAAEAAVSDPDPAVRLKARQITQRVIEKLQPEQAPTPSRMASTTAS
ncbi:MAG: HEAT repeat domain-containing protein [Planctomycetota bacterium]